MPALDVKIANTSEEPIEGVLRVDKRPDWAIALLHLSVLKEGRPVEVDVVICDPGVVTPNDDASLQAGEEMSLRMDWFPECYDQLPPGEYEAFLTYHLSAKTLEGVFQSNSVKLVVVPEKEPNQPPQTTPVSAPR